MNYWESSYKGFLILHRTVWLALVAGLATNKLWSYRAAIAVFTGFAIYQIYRLVQQNPYSEDCHVPHRVLKKEQAHDIEGVSWARCELRPRLGEAVEAGAEDEVTPNEIGGQNRNSGLNPGPKTGRQHLFAYKRGYCEAGLG